MFIYIYLHIIYRSIHISYKYSIIGAPGFISRQEEEDSAHEAPRFLKVVQEVLGKMSYSFWIQSHSHLIFECLISFFFLYFFSFSKTTK